MRDHFILVNRRHYSKFTQQDYKKILNANFFRYNNNKNLWLKIFFLIN